MTHRADRAAERLSELLPMRVTVRRDGRRPRVDAVDVVVGDVLMLECGYRIPADAPLARQLGHANPPLAGWLVALAGPVVLLAADAVHKQLGRQ